jgi:anti-sigma regulatory factor (Ser/Thr protein kinase)
MVVRNDLAELARVGELANELLERQRVDESAAYATQLALEEVLSNVIRHGYDDGGEHEIVLVLRVGGSGVEVRVEDDGKEFDPLAAPPPQLDLPLASRRVGGLGLHLLRAFVREVRYERRGQRNALSLRI